MPRTVRLHRFGLLPYHHAWDWQRETAAAVREGADEALALLQHPHVYTFGRRVHAENLLVSPADAEVVESDRGGDVTYHGPGQLVAYPILDLRRRNLGAADYVHLLEEVMIRTTDAFSVHAQRVPGRPGVWVQSIPSPLGGRGPARGVDAANEEPPLAKLGAIGVRVQGGVTTHGLALNVAPDLARFDAIVPCGLAGIAVTSLARQLRRAPALEAVTDALTDAFETVFDCALLTPAPTPSPDPTVLLSPSPQGGEGRAPVLSRVEGAAGERSGDPPVRHCEPSRQRGAAIWGGAAPRQAQQRSVLASVFREAPLGR